MTVSQPIPYVSPRATEIAGRIVPLSEVTLDLRARYLVKGWLDRGALSVIYGESNVGKTFLALDLALHVAAGTAWHGHRVKGGPVVYIACEGGGGIEKRLIAVRQAMPELSACADDSLSVIREMVDLHGDIDAAAIIRALGIRGIQNPALIIVDTLARAMGAGDENTAKDMGQFVQSVDAIRQATGAHVAIIHHSGKDAGKGARGSGSLRAAVDTEIELRRNGAAIVATATKQRDMVCGAEFAYRLVSVELGYDSDGEALTSAIVEQSEIPQPRAAKLSGQALIAMQAFGDALAAHGEIKRGGDFPPNRQCVSLAHWREACDRHSLTDGEDESAPRKAFARAWKALQEREIIKVLDEFAWRVADE
jgi:hypothetical protein